MEFSVTLVGGGSLPGFMSDAWLDSATYRISVAATSPADVNLYHIEVEATLNGKNSTL